MPRLFGRRDFLRAAGASFAAALAPRPAVALAKADAVFVSAYKAPNGSYGVATLTEAGEIVHTYRLPMRGHDVVAHHASGRCAAFARRPGTHGLAFDSGDRARPQVFSTPAGRHFYGHGAFSADGRLLYATENDFDGVRGVVGIYDATDGYNRIGELPTHGLGPHELMLMPDGRTLAIANGGIETHPDYGRAQLNLSAMQSSIAFVDCETGDLLARHDLPKALSRLSTRHVDVDAEGRLWFGCQYQGEAGDHVPLIGHAGIGEPMQWLEMPEEAGAALLNYVGAIVINRHSGVIGVTSPKGNAAIEIRPDAPGDITVRRIEGVSGIAIDKAGFVYSSMAGSFNGRPTPQLWDNHIRLI
ncbi:MAG: DUF1513 domain-containing protein [Salaquimonas sp.]|jgi:hypothetical protein|nr:DUF1513 domain-containing protein [Salaquimonas sp.]